MGMVKESLLEHINSFLEEAGNGLQQYEQAPNAKVLKEIASNLIWVQETAEKFEDEAVKARVVPLAARLLPILEKKSVQLEIPVAEMVDMYGLNAVIPAKMYAESQSTVKVGVEADNSRSLPPAFQSKFIVNNDGGGNVYGTGATLDIKTSQDTVNISMATRNAIGTGATVNISNRPPRP